MVNPTSFSLDQALANLTASFNGIYSLVVSLSVVIGIFMAVKGVMGFKTIATQTFSSAQRGELAGPIIHIVIGVLLIYLPQTTTTGLTTIFGSASVSASSELIGYNSISHSAKWQDIADVVLMYTKLIGLIAFIRGWVILSKMAGSQNQPGSVGKGMIHVIGGILLINIVDTFNLLASTLGYTGT